MMGRVKNNRLLESSIRRSLEKLDPATIAKKSGWMRRLGSKLDSSSWRLACVAASAIPTASLRTVAFFSGMLRRTTVSRQALRKRVRAKGPAFLKALLAAALKSECSPSSESLGCLGFKRVLIQDATSMNLPLRMRGAYKGPGNAYCESSSPKIQAVFDLLGGVFASLKIGAYVDTDGAAAQETVALVEPGDLLRWDLGYFNIAAFGDIVEKGADILTRAKSGIVMEDPRTRQRIDLPELLRSSGDFDGEVLVGDKHELAMRMLAFKLPGKVADERRRKAKADAKRRGKTLSKAASKLLDWQVYLTSCSKKKLPGSKAKELYCQRWGIEILFKAMKSHMRLADIPPQSSLEMVQCLVYATLLRIVLCHATVLPWARSVCGSTRVSALKLASLVEALGAMPLGFQFDQETLEANLIKHCQYDKRKRRNLFQRLEGLG